jgi:uncharacterized protein (TIGR02172 family)
MIKIAQCNPLASGGQADIFELPDGRILRLLRKPEDEFLVRYEITVLKTVRSHGIFAPEAFEVVTVDNRPGFIMERIYGESMQAKLFQKPLTILQTAWKLADLHMRLGAIEATPEILNTKIRARAYIAQSGFLSQEHKDFAVQLLNELPDKACLCHGDFHPGNILVNKAGNHIIDWCGATKGDILSDIAHTYLLLKNTPKLPHISWLMNAVTKATANIMARTYLQTCNQLQNFDWNDFSKWTIVRAAERTFFGLPSEKSRLVKYITECYQRHLGGKPANDWYKSL